MLECFFVVDIIHQSGTVNYKISLDKIVCIFPTKKYICLKRKSSQTVFSCTYKHFQKYAFSGVFECNLFGVSATMNYTNSLRRPLYFSHIKNYMFREVGTSFINNTCTGIVHKCWAIFMIFLNRFFLVLKTYLTTK